jgi:hypothetical protein
VSRTSRPKRRAKRATFDESADEAQKQRGVHRILGNQSIPEGTGTGDSASINAPTQISIPLTASDPSTAVIAAWLVRHPPNRSRAALLRAVLATGIQLEAALARIESRLDALVAQGVAVPSAGGDEPSANDELRPFLDGLFDFAAAES